MRHVQTISRVPATAQTGICDSVGGDFQAQLCFLYQILVNFFLPLAGLKTPSDPGNGTTE